jgi:predicted RNase H-like nuclease (RuvC/YqgF family)
VPAKEKKSKKGKGKKEKAYKQIKASPSGIKKLNLTIKNNEAEIAELNRIIRREKDNVLPLLMGNTDLFKDFILESTGNIKEWTGKLKKLTNETEDLKKQLKKQDKGFANKKPNKRK